MNHTEECRQRIMSKLEDEGDERVEQETSRLFEYLKEKHGEDGEKTRTEEERRKSEDRKEKEARRIKEWREEWWHERKWRGE